MRILAIDIVLFEVMENFFKKVLDSVCSLGYNSHPAARELEAERKLS